MLWGPRSGSIFTVWISYKNNVSSEIFLKVTMPFVISSLSKGPYKLVFISFNHADHTAGAGIRVSRALQIGVLEDTRNRTLHGILRVQSSFRGYQARCRLKELKMGISILQSWDIGWLKSGGTKTNESGEVLVKASVLSELQRRVLKAEAALREKEEENDILQQRLQQYENRWSEYETKMKSMEEIWQKQMRSLQSSLSIAKKSLAVEDSARNSDASVNASDATDWDSSSNQFRSQTSNGGGSRLQPMSAGLSVIGRLAEEFEQRAQVFGDDAKFLVEVKSGQVVGTLSSIN
ncbi:unnamed protein product [Arabidopsis halleri]